MANEFREAVSHAHLPWMAQYLIKRAGIEPNLHSLYMAFIDYLEDMPLFELVLQETYSQIREILLADQPFTGPSLKNLGHWLGLQTLARDKGVSEEWLPLKEVILSAAHGDLSDLLYVFSFVSQLLGHSAHSRIFQPSHPWIVDILFLLGQLYTSFSSNLHLCLAIEIIFTHLSIDISDFYRARVPGSTPGTVGLLPAPRGVSKTEVTFDIDAIGVVHMSAKDQGTQKEQQIVLQSSGGLSTEKIKQMVHEVEQFAESDKQKKDLIEVVNSADTQQNMDEYKSQLPPEDLEVKNVEEEISDLSNVRSCKQG